MNERRPPPWLEYERALLSYLETGYSSAEVRHDVRLRGVLSGVDRQIDILVREQINGREVTTAFEAKCFGRRVNVKHVEEAIGLFRDVGVDRGVVVTTQGYSEAAMQRANADDVEIELDILNLSDLGRFQSDGGGLPYSGRHGVTLAAPLGWIVDGSRFAAAPARLYRRGLSFEEAVAEHEFMYVQFWTKDSDISSARELMEWQNETLLAEFPDARLEVEPLILTEAWTVDALIRTARNAYPWLEITGCVEFEEFLFFVVLHTPEVVAGRNRRKLEYVIRRALPFGVRRK